LVYIAIVSGFSSQYNNAIWVSGVVLRERQKTKTALGNVMVCCDFYTPEAAFRDELNAQFMKIDEDHKIQ